MVASKSLRWGPLRLLAALALLMLASQACSPRLATAIPSLTQPASDDPQGSSPETATPLPPTALPRIDLAVPVRWYPEVEALLSDLPAHLPQIQLHVADVPSGGLEDSPFDIALVSGTDGQLVAQRALALAVPWTSAWEQVSMAEALELRGEGSPFVALVEWPNLPATLKPMRVDGMHPSQPGYPLQDSWSLESREGFDEYAAALAEILTPALQASLVKVVAVGDIMLARGLGDSILSGGHPFSAVQHLLVDADLTLGNLESAIGSGGRPEHKGYTFLAPAEAAVTLAQAGFDVLSLANNHAIDYGNDLLLEAIELLANNGIRSVGAGSDEGQAYAPSILQINGVRIALLAFVDVPVEVRGFDTRSWAAHEGRGGVAWADPELMGAAIESARRSAEVIIVMLHSGYEYVTAPSPPQQAAARLAIDAGAHLVLGHHAHVLQGVEFYGGGVIVYGLGNFAFDGGGVTDSGLINIWLDQEGVRSLEFVPLVVSQDGRPLPPVSAHAVAIREHFLSLTRSILP